MTDTAESLAQDVIDGRYIPSAIDDCNADLPTDRNPHVIRYRSFSLFAESGPIPTSPKEPGYLILAQYKLRNRDPQPEKAVTDQLIKPLSQSLAQEFIAAPPEQGPLPPHGCLPDPEDKRTDIDRLRLIGVERRVPGYRAELSDAETRSLYKTWFKDQIADVLRDQVMERVELLERAGFDVSDDVTGDLHEIKNLSSVFAGIMGKILLPSPYQPFRNPHPHFALCATFEQVWQPQGYTRGELLNSIGLAPGEQLTLEVHSWDKSTIKSEQELATESEMKVSENISERDVRTVARQVSSGFNMGGTVPVKGGGSINFGGNLNTNVNETLEQTRERTVEASNTLKNTRRLRIEVAREVGREQKQTRVIANTNRCHAVNCHYFEVMASYLVTTRLVSLTPCLLLNNPQFKATPDWVLCHEHVLIAALLDKTYLPGFEAARTLATHVKFIVLAEQEEQEGGAVNPVEEELKAHVDAILQSYDELKKPTKSVKNALRSNECKLAKRYSGRMGWALCVATKVRVTALRRMLYYASLHGNRTAINALEKLEGETGPAWSAALQNFFAAVTPRDFQFPGPAADIANGLEAIGIPEKLVDALLKWGVLSYVDFALDDGGLYNDVKAAATKLKSLMAVPTGTEPTVVKEGGYTKMEIAQAQTVFGQLACHLDKNWVHYTQAILTLQDGDQRFVNLQGYGAVAGILDNELLGFLGHKAAYPIKDLEAVKPWLDFDVLRREVQPTTPGPQLVTLPTHGTVLEAIVAECDACEDFIRASRVHDLQTQKGKADQETLKAERLRKRLDQNPPLLDDPDAVSSGVTINVDGTPNNNG